MLGVFIYIFYLYFNGNGGNNIYFKITLNYNSGGLVYLDNGDVLK